MRFIRCALICFIAFSLDSIIPSSYSSFRTDENLMFAKSSCTSLNFLYIHMGSCVIIRVFATTLRCELKNCIASIYDTGNLWHANMCEQNTCFQWRYMNAIDISRAHNTAGSWINWLLDTFAFHHKNNHFIKIVRREKSREKKWIERKIYGERDLRTCEWECECVYICAKDIFVWL